MRKIHLPDLAPKPGRQQLIQDVCKRLASILGELEFADAIVALHFVQAAYVRELDGMMERADHEKSSLIVPLRP